MQDVIPISPLPGQSGGRRVLTRVLEYLPRGNNLDEKAWRRRHRLLEWVLLLHVPALVVLGVILGHSTTALAAVVAPTVICLVVGCLVTQQRWASFFVTGGLVFCSIALVLITRGTIESHFHFFIIIGFIALYQDWVPFLWNVAFTVLSHGIGTIWLGGQIFNHPAAQQHPWLWSFIHGVAVLFGCVGICIFWRVTEDEQTEKEALGRQLITADAEIGRRQFTSDMLVNLARRNQSMLYRQLDIINQLEDKERDPDALSDLFKLDHLATRVRRNAESLLVLAGERAPRTWSAPVALRDVVRAAIAETEDLDRVVFAVDDRVSVSGASVADLTHLLAELTENAVRFSPPETAVTIRARPNRRDEGGQLLTVEDWGVGMPPDDLAEANDLLSHPREVDLAVSQRLGFHVVARLAARHGITVSLSTTPGSGITAVVVLPGALFTRPPRSDGPATPPSIPGPDGARPYVAARTTPSTHSDGRESGWIDAVPAVEGAPARPGPGLAVTRNGDAWLPPEPFAAPGTDSGPMGPEGRWRGWWNPEVHGADAAVNGPVLSGHASNGQDSNGHGSNGQGSNGQGSNGHGSNGHGSNGHQNGHGGPGGNGNGSAWGERDTGGQGATGSPWVVRPAGGPALAGLAAHADGPDGAPRPGDPAGPRPDGVGSEGRRGDENDDGPSRAAHSELVPKAGAPGDRPRIPGARQELPTVGQLGMPGRASLEGPRPFPTVPTAMTPPAAPALPQPREDEPAGAPGPSVAGGRGRGLRRRVPQSHLAPELRHLTNGGLADARAPLSADAATALSRYQASRLAAQAVVDVADESSSREEGERE